MRRLSHRLAKLERAFGARLNAPCRVCGGGGRIGIEVRLKGDPPRPTPPCPGCGRSRVIKVIILEGKRPSGAAA